MPTKTDDVPLFATVAQLESDHRIANAQRRVSRWESDGLLSPSGSYQPPTGRAENLYPVGRVFELLKEKR